MIVSFLLINDSINLKNASFLFTAVGILSVLFALTFLLIIKYLLYKGLGVSFLICGVLQIVVGIISNHTLQKLQATDYSLTLSVLDYQKLQLSATVILLLIYFLLKHKNVFWKGLLLGLIVEFLVTFGMTFFLA